MAFAADGKLLASGSDDKTIKLWNMPMAKELATLRGHGKSVTSLAFTPDGQTLASTGMDRHVKLWSIPQVREVLDLAAICGRGPGGLGWFGGCKPLLKRWGPLTRTLIGHKQWAMAVAVRPDGSVLATGGGEFSKAGHVRLWRVVDGKAILTLESAGPARGLAFSRDGKRLACAAGKGVYVWTLPPLP